VQTLPSGLLAEHRQQVPAANKQAQSVWGAPRPLQCLLARLQSSPLLPAGQLQHSPEQGVGQRLDGGAPSSHLHCCV
jgi:hypothetical protein